MAIITLALEVTPGPLRFHLGRGAGMARFLAGEGRAGAGGEGREGRPGPARLGPAPHAAARSRGSLRGRHRGGRGSAPLPAAALKGAGRPGLRAGRDLTRGVR